MMIMLTEKTFDEHVDYLHGITRLMLWFLWHWAHAHPEEDLCFILRERVDIYRKTEVNPTGINPPEQQWDDPRWLAMEAEIERLYWLHRDDAAAFEEAAFAVFRPSIDARAPRDFTDNSRLAPYEYGSIRFDPPRPDTPQRVSIHIANTVMPQSIFTDPAHLPACLREVMRRAEAAHGATELGTSTWLNEHPRWLALFPCEWQQHLSPPEETIRWHYGYWGQFINARGAFNEKLAAQFRATGRMPYLPRYSWCSFAALKAHLEQLQGTVPDRA